ncbi:MAG: glycosyltransferase [Achromobacter sp.]|uniref:glycosyltransferase family protein n=1 Tax=Achromobacter sp. TaxID=134375 RepID=UPI0012C18119|nr:glycosyltransferase [Achromobacter sp.]
MTQQSLVQRAADEFLQGHFLRALDLYRRLGEQLGEKYFRANISLCEKRLVDLGRAISVRPTLRNTKVACVMDEFTFHCYDPECELLQLTPAGALEELEAFTPDLLFIESAWRGKDELWVRKIGSLSQELRAVLQWCKERGVPTVFWNKEDPVHFESFLTTAREFDFVFTTDIDCIARYKAALGHEQVYLLPFACQPKLHNPIEQYERKDGFCFAGAYYVRYPERTRDLENYVKEFPKYKALEIFDRNFGKDDPNYKFPTEYQPYIVGTLPFNEIDKAYKGYRYSINLNSVKQSQTMFARRVYELLGSNTLTVSNFSRGIRLLFGDLVISSDSGSEIVERVRQMDDEAEQKHRLAALRKVMLEHTYRHRLAYVVSKALGHIVEDDFPPMTILTIVATQQEYQWALDNFSAQNYEPKKLILVLKQGFELALEALHRSEDRATVLTEQTATQTLARESVGENGWLAFMEAADYYGPNYLLDVALASCYTDAGTIGKAQRYRLIDGKIVLGDQRDAYRPASRLLPRASAVRSSALAQDAVLTGILKDARGSGWEAAGLSIDPFNYCENGRSAAEGDEVARRVNDLPLDIGLPIGQLLRDGEEMPPMECDADALPKWNSSKFHQLFGAVKHADITLEPAAGTLNIKSTLADARHEYFYAGQDFPISVFASGDVIKSHLEVSPGLEIQYVFVFYDVKKERIFHIVHTANRNQTVSVPSGAAFVRLGLRIRGRGEAQLKSLFLDHRKFNSAKLFGRSDILLLTNHYPSYDNLYRNGFVHSRVKSYLERQVQVDVFRLQHEEMTSYGEFQNVDVVTGNQAALRTLLEGGRYKHILVHFLTPEMWAVLKQFPQLQITVWVHGSEIQPWHRRDYNYQTEQELGKAKGESDLRMEFWRNLLQPMAANLKLVFVSRYFAEEVFEDLGFRVAEDRYEVIHNPIDTALFSYEPKPIEQRKRILSIRPYASRKYANDLSVKAILKLSESASFSEMKFRMIGDGKLFDETLEPLRKFSNVEIERRFLTHPEIAEIHKQYGVCLTPTRMDAQGVSRDEAMSSGLIPITNAVAAIPEFVDERCGMLAGPDDADGLAAGILAVYENPALFTSLSKAAADRVYSQSGVHVIVRKELALFATREIQ